MSSAPLVTVVLPTIGASGAVGGVPRVFAMEAVASLLRTTQVPVEIVAVTGPAMPPDVGQRLVAVAADAGVQCTLVPITGGFNFSASVNLGAAHARGRHVLLLNDDTEAIGEGWLEAMLAALDPGDGPPVGAVGAKLLFEDGTLQHAGHTYRTSLDHVGFGLPGDSVGRTGLLAQRRQVVGVTAACMLTPREVYSAVGGFCTALPGNYNDVDYCMKVSAAGWAIVYEPAAVLYHYESRSRQSGVSADEIVAIQSRWGTRLSADPFTPFVV